MPCRHDPASAKMVADLQRDGRFDEALDRLLALIASHPAGNRCFVSQLTEASNAAFHRNCPNLARQLSRFAWRQLQDLSRDGGHLRIRVLVIGALAHARTGYSHLAADAVAAIKDRPVRRARSQRLLALASSELAVWDGRTRSATDFVTAIPHQVSAVDQVQTQLAFARSLSVKVGPEEAARCLRDLLNKCESASPSLRGKSRSVAARTPQNIDKALIGHTWAAAVTELAEATMAADMPVDAETIAALEIAMPLLQKLGCAPEVAAACAAYAAAQPQTAAEMAAASARRALAQKITAPHQLADAFLLARWSESTERASETLSRLDPTAETQSPRLCYMPDTSIAERAVKLFTRLRGHGDKDLVEAYEQVLYVIGERYGQLDHPDLALRSAQSLTTIREQRYARGTGPVTAGRALVEARTLRAGALSALKRWDEAIDTLRNAAHLSSQLYMHDNSILGSDRKAWTQLIDVLISRGKWNEATRARVEMALSGLDTTTTDREQVLTATVGGLRVAELQARERNERIHADQCTAERIEVLRLLAEGRPQHRAALAEALVGAANVLPSPDPAARAMLVEAVERARAWARAEAGSANTLLAKTLADVGYLRAFRDRDEAGLLQLQEAAQLLRARQEPDIDTYAELANILELQTNCLSALGCPDSALEALTEAYQLRIRAAQQSGHHSRSDLEDTARKLVAALRRADHQQRIIDVLDDVLALNELESSFRHWALVSCGRAHLRLGQASVALQQYKAALAINPEDSDTRLQLAHALWLIGESDAALSEADRVLDRAPDTWAWVFRGACKLLLGRVRLAREDLAAAVAASRPVLPFAAVWLAFAQLVGNRATEAVTSAHSAMLRAPDDPWVRYTYSLALFAAGEPDEARQQWNFAIADAVDRDGRGVAFDELAVLALCYAALGDSAQAVTICQRALDRPVFSADLLEFRWGIGLLRKHVPGAGPACDAIEETLRDVAVVH